MQIQLLSVEHLNVYLGTKNKIFILHISKYDFLIYASSLNQQFVGWVYQHWHHGSPTLEFLISSLFARLNSRNSEVTLGKEEAGEFGPHFIHFFFFKLIGSSYSYYRPKHHGSVFFFYFSFFNPYKQLVFKLLVFALWPPFLPS